uniref:histidine kinase n=1 Tax=Solibacter usitatus (strain Ellin6076) TaxID=234267 RepID=Q01NJ7_SOLUE
MENETLLTKGAARYLRLMLRAIAPMAGRLDRECRVILRASPHEPALIRSLLAITPVAASRLRTIAAFLEQVEYNGRRIAKMNLPPGEAIEILVEYDRLLEGALEGRFAPAREQLQLVTRLVLNRAYYQVREAEAQTFFGLYHAEAEARDLDQLLDLLVNILTRTFRAQSGRLHLLEAPPTGRLARPLYIKGGSGDERLIVCDAMRGGHKSYWSFPIHHAALLQLGFDRPYPWLARELAMLYAAGARCYEAIERARMEKEVRYLEAEARRAEEEERRRIGRDLHDDTSQSLAWLRLHLEMLESDAPAALRPRLTHAREVTQRAVEEIRRTIAALSPAVVERLGLGAALRQLTARFAKQHTARFDLEIQGESEGLSRETAEVVYRVAQESLQNVLKHSESTRVKLLLRSADKNIRLSVRDDGAGFSPETAAAKPMSFGLAGMRDRAALLGGRLAVRSAPGKGVTVLLDLPRTSAKGGKSCPKQKFS